MDRHDPQTASSTPPPLSRRASRVGTLIALLVVAAVGWLAWYLVHRPAAPPGRPGGVPTAAGPRAAGGAGAGGAGGGAPRGLPPTTVGVATVQRADIPVNVEALGTVIPSATAKVRPEVSGVLQQVVYREGQMVKRGDLLAVIDPRPFQIALQQATGQRMRDEAQLAAAKVTLARDKTLLQQDSIARQEVDTQQALVQQLEATLVVDKAVEAGAKLNLDRTRITAPIAGRVGLRTVDVGNMVTPSDANGVAVITQLSPADVQFAVPQDLVGALRPAVADAAPVKALDRSRSQVLATGRLMSYDNQIDTQTGTVRAKARFDNADGALFPNQFVNVQLRLRTIEGALVVPVSAVRAGPGGDQVFVIQPDRTVSLRPVQRGQVVGERVQITQGLHEGEKVVTEGADRLREGSRVTLPGGAGGRGPAPAAPDMPAAASPAPAPAPAAGSALAALPPAGPTPEQRKRLLESAQGDPQQLARRQQFLEALDRGDPAALERWQRLQQRRPAGAGAEAAAQ